MAFLERFGHRLRHREASGNYLDSAAIPSGAAKDAWSALRLTYCLTKRGVWLELPGEVFRAGATRVEELARDLQEHSRLGGNKQLESVGLRVEVDEKIRLRAGSAEARLHTPEEGLKRIRFPTLTVCHGQEAWLRGELPDLPPLSLEDRCLLARWRYPHRAWMDENLIARLS